LRSYKALISVRVNRGILKVLDWRLLAGEMVEFSGKLSRDIGSVRPRCNSTCFESA